MTKKTTPPAPIPNPDLRADADAAVAAWRELDAAAKAARAVAPVRLAARRSPSVDDLSAVSADVEALEAERSAEHARYRAVEALDSAERAGDGDELARLRDPQTFRDDLLRIAEEETEAVQRLEDVRRRWLDRVRAAIGADATHAARRQAAGQPRSAPIPTSRTLSKTLPELLADRVASGEPFQDFSERIENSRRHQLAIAGAIEEERLEREADEKVEAQNRHISAENARRAQAEINSRISKADKEIEADNKRRELLGRSYLARQSAGQS